MTNEKNQPAKRIRAGAVSCAVWVNEIAVNGQNRRVFKVSLDRRYKDSNGRWASTNSLSREDVPYAIYCLQQAFSGMIEIANDQARGGASDEGGEEPA
jgi:hypothetical protein